MEDDVMSLAEKLDGLLANDNCVIEGDDYMNRVFGIELADGDVTEIDKDEFDGCDSSWYWDNDFDCLSATDNLAEEEEEEEEMASIVHSDPQPNNSSCYVVPFVEVGNFDDLLDEEYLKNFEGKFHQAKDFEYNLSSVSSSFGSSSDFSEFEVIKFEENCHVMPDSTRATANPLQLTSALMPLHPASVMMPSGCLIRKVPIGEAIVDDVIESLWRGHEPPAIKNEGSVSKINRKRKKIHRKLTAAGVDTLKNQDWMQHITGKYQGLGFGRGSRKPPISSDPGATSGFSPKLSSSCIVIVVSGLSAVVGIFCGLFIRGFFIGSQDDLLVNFMNNEKLTCEICPAFENERRMILNSIWAQKYEELIIENAELHMKLQHLDSQMSSDFHCAHHSVAGMQKEFGRLNDEFLEFEKLPEEEIVERTTED